MSDIKLFIEGNEVDLGNDNIIIPLVYSILNLRDISKTNGTYSKTVKVPGTKGNNRLFNFLFSQQVVGGSGEGLFRNFDYKKKYSVEVYENNLLLFRGYCQLIEAETINDATTFSLALTSDIIDFAATLAERTLEDISPALTDKYTHTASIPFAVNSWSNQDTEPGSGVFYPVIDYGVEGQLAATVALNSMYLSSLRPCLFAKQYFDLVFENSGFTYESEFINSDYFKRLVVPHIGGNYKGSGGFQAVAANDSERTLAGIVGGWSSPITGTNIFNAEISDPNNLYSGSKYTAPHTSVYDVKVTLPSIAFYFNTPYTSPLWSNAPQRLYVVYKVNGTIRASYYKEYKTDEIIESSTEFTSNGSGGQHYTTPYNFSVEAPTRRFTLNENDELTAEIYLSSSSINGNAKLINNLRITRDGTTTLKISESNPATLTVDTSVNMEGGRVQYRDFCLKGVKQIDFISSILRLFNLHVIPDKLKPKHLKIITSHEYYGNEQTPLDWSAKLSIDQPITVKPIPSLESNALRFGLKEDTDFYNALYKAQSGGVYGELLVNTGYEHSNTVNDVLEKNIFSPTPLVSYTDQPIPCEVTAEVLVSNRRLIQTSGYNEIVGDLPEDGGFKNAKPGVKIIYQGDEYTITEQINPHRFEVDRNVVRSGGAVDGTFYCKADTFYYLTEVGDKIIPAIYESKDNNVTRAAKEFNPRLLYYCGRTSCNPWALSLTPTLVGREYEYTGFWTLVNNIYYPLLGHLNTYDHPTKDLLFARPKQVFFPVSSYPENNSADFRNLTDNWQNTINEIVSNNSRLIKGWFRLLPSDISELDLTRLVYINGINYRINQLEYLPGKELAQVELTKAIERQHYENTLPPEGSTCRRYRVWNHSLIDGFVEWTDCDLNPAVFDLSEGGIMNTCGMSGTMIVPNDLFIVFDLGECDDPIPTECQKLYVVNNSLTEHALVYFLDCDGNPDYVAVPPNLATEICAIAYTGVPAYAEIVDNGLCGSGESVEVDVINDTDTLTITNILNVPGSLWINPLNIVPESSKTLYRNPTGATANVQVQITGTGRALLEMYLNDIISSTQKTSGAGNYNMANRTFLDDTEIRIELKPIPQTVVELGVQGTGTITSVTGIPNLTMTLPTVGTGTFTGSRDADSFTAAISAHTTKITGSISLTVNGGFVQCINLNGTHDDTYTFTSRTYNVGDVIRISIGNAPCI